MSPAMETALVTLKVTVSHMVPLAGMVYLALEAERAATRKRQIWLLVAVLVIMVICASWWGLDEWLVAHRIFGEPL